MSSNADGKVELPDDILAALLDVFGDGALASARLRRFAAQALADVCRDQAARGGGGGASTALPEAVLNRVLDLHSQCDDNHDPEPPPEPLQEPCHCAAPVAGRDDRRITFGSCTPSKRRLESTESPPPPDLNDG
ncbi:hypothetical protein HK405_002375, partial [Cladochytrium tenue]